MRNREVQRGQGGAGRTGRDREWDSKWTLSGQGVDGEGQGGTGGKVSEQGRTGRDREEQGGAVREEGTVRGREGQGGTEWQSMDGEGLSGDPGDREGARGPSRVDPT